MFRLLAPDPVFSFEQDARPGLSGRLHAGTPAAPTAGDPERIGWYFACLTDTDRCGVGYAQVGQENNFLWENIRPGFEPQLKQLLALSRAGKLRIETMAESAAWFGRKYALTPPVSWPAVTDWEGRPAGRPGGRAARRAVVRGGALPHRLSGRARPPAHPRLVFVRRKFSLPLPGKRPAAPAPGGRSPGAHAAPCGQRLRGAAAAVCPKMDGRRGGRGQADPAAFCPAGAGRRGAGGRDSVFRPGRVDGLRRTVRAGGPVPIFHDQPDAVRPPHRRSGGGGGPLRCRFDTLPVLEGLDGGSVLLRAGGNLAIALRCSPGSRCPPRRTGWRSCPRGDEICLDLAAGSAPDAEVLTEDYRRDPGALGQLSAPLGALPFRPGAGACAGAGVCPCGQPV